MTCEYINASDEIYDKFLNGFKIPADRLLGYIPEIRFRNVESSEPPPRDKFWIRISVNTETETQTNVSANVFNGYKRRYTTRGLVFVQIFCPKVIPGSKINSDKLGQHLADICKKCFRGKQTKSAIIFRNTRINDGIPPEELYYRFNVISEFEYDTIT